VEDGKGPGPDSEFGADAHSLVLLPSGAIRHMGKETAKACKLWKDGDLLGVEIDMIMRRAAFFHTGAHQPTWIANLPAAVRIAVCAVPFLTFHSPLLAPPLPSSFLPLPLHSPLPLPTPNPPP
jgi:hypothetical protein